MALALATYYFFSQETSSVITPLVGRLIDIYGKFWCSKDWL